MRDLDKTARFVPWGILLLGCVFLGLAGCSLFFPNKAPTAAFTLSPSTGQAPLTVNFNALLASDPDGTITDFEWDFGDGGNGIGSPVSHTYTTGGPFTIVLRVTDDGGATATTQKTITILPPEPPGPAARFTATPTSGTSPLVIQLNATGSSYHLSPLTYGWDLGDGSSGSGATLSHVFVSSTTKTFTVTLTVRGPDGREGKATGAITVAGPGGGGITPQPDAPSARFTVDTVDAWAEIAPLTIEFDPSDSEADSGRILTTYTWSFGDLGTVTTNSPSKVQHTYTTTSASQIFTATLIVIDDKGAVGTTTRTIKVKDRQPVAGFEINDAAGGAGTWTPDDVTFYSYPDPGGPVTLHFRSAAPTWGAITLPNGGSTRPTNHDSSDKNLSYDPEGHQPASGWGIVTYLWTWGDGSGPQSVPAGGTGGCAPTHLYTLDADEQQRTFTVKIEAIDALGARATLSRTITITKAGP